jgi:hypothetical protein
VLAFIDIDSTQKRVYGHRKEGSAFGHGSVRFPVWGFSGFLSYPFLGEPAAHTTVWPY